MFSMRSIPMKPRLKGYRKSLSWGIEPFQIWRRPCQSPDNTSNTLRIRQPSRSSNSPRTSWKRSRPRWESQLTPYCRRYTTTHPGNKHKNKLMKDYKIRSMSLLSSMKKVRSNCIHRSRRHLVHWRMSCQVSNYRKISRIVPYKLSSLLTHPCSQAIYWPRDSNLVSKNIKRI